MAHNCTTGKRPFCIPATAKTGYIPSFRSKNLLNLNSLYTSTQNPPILLLHKITTVVKRSLLA